MQSIALQLQLSVFDALSAKRKVFLEAIADKFMPKYRIILVTSETVPTYAVAVLDVPTEIR